MACQQSGHPAGFERFTHFRLADAGCLKSTAQTVTQVEEHIQHFPEGAFLGLAVHLRELGSQIGKRSECLTQLLEAPPLKFHLLG